MKFSYNGCRGVPVIYICVLPMLVVKNIAIMKNPELFHKTVGILVKAYLEGSLTHGTGCGCAVGNLILANNPDIKFINKGPDSSWILPNGVETIYPYWNWVHNTGSKYEDDGTVGYEYGLNELLSTGYSISQTFQIENAFERAVSWREKDRVYLSLMVVVDVLMQIHEATPEEAIKAKALFVKD